MGARSAGNPHAACDVAGTGNVAWPRYCDTRKRKSEPTGNTNFDLNRRASPRPYREVKIIKETAAKAKKKPSDAVAIISYDELCRDRHSSSYAGRRTMPVELGIVSQQY